MQALNYYYQVINGLYDMTETEKDLLSQMVIEQTFEPNTHLLKIGEVSDTIHFISKGLVRTYYTEAKSGEQMTTWFMPEGGFIYSIKSYMSGVPSSENIIAEETTTTLSIKKSDWQKILRQSIGMANVALQLMEQYLYICDERLRLLKYPAQDPYLHFTTQYKGMESRLKPEHIASYLGISRSTLFSIRKKRI